MNIGFCGLGKLGLPCVFACDSKGHNVVGYDVSPKVAEIVATKKLPYREIWAQEHLTNSKIEVRPIAAVVKHADIIFVPIHTPLDEKYECVTRIPDTRVDFDYDYLNKGISDLAAAIDAEVTPKTVIIISTVLPGTISREIKPLLNSNVRLCYNPFFIAMGTTMRDFLNPEFVLFGVDDETAAKQAADFYRTLHDRPFFKTSIDSAELIKVAYNTFIGMKIVFANTMMEICHKTNANVDDVSEAIKMASDRLISPKYLNAGMGDGGGCHPRDNIAMSWLAQKLELKYDFFEALMIGREKQTEWLADLVIEHKSDLPVIILGKSFKEETNLTVGSPAILLKNILDERDVPVEMYDPHVDDHKLDLSAASMFFIGTKHLEFKNYNFAAGSVVIDPWRYIADQQSVTVIRLGQ